VTTTVWLPCVATVQGLGVQLFAMMKIVWHEPWAPDLVHVVIFRGPGTEEIVRLVPVAALPTRSMVGVM
jgi:hypothetical protein